MEFKFEKVETICECGALHCFKPTVYEKNEWGTLKNFMKSSGFHKVRCFFDEKSATTTMAREIINFLEDHGMIVSCEVVKSHFAEVVFASNIEYNQEDYVIIFGDFFVADIAKYYAKMMGIGVSYFVFGTCFDFSMSRYALLYDGICYNFYETFEPDFVICFSEFLNFDILQMKKYFKSKSIALFENVFSSKVDEKSVCKKVNFKIKKVLRLSNVVFEPLQIVGLCLYVGRCMSFFCGSKFFFGAEIALCGALIAKTKQNFLDCYLMASKIIDRTYKVGLQGKLVDLNLDLNKRIDKIKRQTKLSGMACMKFVKKTKDMVTLKKVVRVVSAIKYMLGDLLCDLDHDIVSSFCKNDILECLYLSPEFSSRYYFLNVIRDLGYLENLTT